MNKKFVQLQDQVDELRGELNELKRRFIELYENFDSRVDANIKNKIYFQTVENLNNYKKGKELEKPLNKIKEILK